MVKSEEQARVSSGRLFHARAAATGKARSPRVARRVDGTLSLDSEWTNKIILPTPSTTVFLFYFSTWLYLGNAGTEYSTLCSQSLLDFDYVE